MSRRALATVERARKRRTDADGAYIAAVLAARDNGCSVASIARAAGVTRQAVGQLLRRERGTERNTTTTEG